METCDLAIIGAGPAGAAAALAARRCAPAARVVLLDRADFPRDKPCGDGIAGHAVDALAALGAADAVDGYRPVGSLRIIGPHGGTAAGATTRRHWVVPRRVFDARLVDAADRAGVERRVHRVRQLRETQHGVEIDGSLLAGAVVAADGVNSRTRRLLGVPRNPERHLAVAVRGYVDVDADDAEQLIELVPGEQWPAYWWRFPIGDGTANVGYGLYRRGTTPSAPQLHARLRALAGRGDVRELRAHHLAMSTHRPVPGRGRVLLAGDAASLINPLSGEGIYYAVVSGRLAAEAALSGSDPLPRYAARLDAVLGRHLRTTDRVSRALASPMLVDAAIAACGNTAGRLDELGDLALGAGTVRLATLAAVAGAVPGAVRRGGQIAGARVRA